MAKVQFFNITHASCLLVPVRAKFKIKASGMFSLPAKLRAKLQYIKSNNVAHWLKNFVAIWKKRPPKSNFDKLKTTLLSSQFRFPSSVLGANLKASFVVFTVLQMGASSNSSDVREFACAC